MVIYLLLFAFAFPFIFGDPQCFSDNSKAPVAQMTDCVDVFERILSDDISLMPFDLTQSQDIITFPYSEVSQSCSLQMNLLQENINATFSLMDATKIGTDILGACMISGVPKVGGKMCAGPSSELLISVGSSQYFPQRDKPNLGFLGPHGVPMGG